MTTDERGEPAPQRTLDASSKGGVRARARSTAEAARKRREKIGLAYERLSMPLAIFFLLNNPHFRPKYQLGWRKKFRLGWRLYRNTRRIRTGISYKAHLAMAAKLFELAPTVKGAVVECGCWLGGTTANLSLICDVVDRQLIVYDSFEGLPAPVAGDEMKLTVAGTFRGDLDDVRRHVRRYGAIERCEFRKGWFADTLPHHREPIALCFVDVDLKSSMHDCIVNLWPHLVDGGYVFFDEYTRLDNCALFYSERFWREHFDRDPPGLMGAGTGVGVGQFYIGPWADEPPAPMIQRPTSVGYTRKDFCAGWNYEPPAR